MRMSYEQGASKARPSPDQRSGVFAFAQHPLAAVVIGGLIGSPAFTVFLLPLLYGLDFRSQQGVMAELREVVA
jgi:hypothetical protein